MLKKILIFVLLLLTCLCLSMSFVSANNITDIDDSINNDKSIENHPSKSFTDLNKKINDLNKSEIILEDDYIHQESDTGNHDYLNGSAIVFPHWMFPNCIVINRSVSIDGQGHVINGNRLSEIFFIEECNVTLKNIKFKNSNGEAISGNAANLTCINCTFMNCSSYFFSASVINAYTSNLDIINCTFINNTCQFTGNGCMNGGSVIRMNTGRIINSTFIDNYFVELYGGESFTAIYYNDWTCNVVNETIQYAINKITEIIYMEKGVIINSTFINYPTHIITHNWNIIPRPALDDDYPTMNNNTTNPSNNSSDVNNTNKTYESPSVHDDVDKNMSQITLLLSINADDKYIIGKGEVINIVFKTNIMNKNFWVEIPGLLSKRNLTSDKHFSASITIKDIIKSGNYTVLCGFYDYNPLIVGADDNQSVACRKNIEIIYTKNNDANNNETIVENHQTKSFTDLNKKINDDLNQTEIILEDDYINQETHGDYKGYYLHGDLLEVITTGIFINRSVCIDGQGHVIDANNLSEIFYLNANNTTLKNIIFKNARGFNFGAIYCNTSNISIINCTFINNEGLFAGAVYCNNQNISIINSTFRNNAVEMGAGAIRCEAPVDLINSTFINNYGNYDEYNRAYSPVISSLKGGRIINSTFIDNYIYNKAEEKYAGIYYSDIIFNVVNETIAYSENCDKVSSVVNGKFIIINSTFKNKLTHEIHYNRPMMILDYDDTNKTNPSNNSDVNNTNKSDDIGTIVPEDVDKDIPQITPTVSINADDTYIIGKGEVINIVFKTNIMNKNFWVEIPGLLSKRNLTSDKHFSASITIKDIIKSGNYTVLCGFYDHKPLIVGADDNQSVACRKNIEIIYTKNNSNNNTKSDNVNTTDTNNNPTNATNNETDVVNPIPVNTTSEVDIKPVAPIYSYKKSSSIIVAKNNIFKKKLKTKRYNVILKSKTGKVLKNTWITLKIKGKLFKVKTNNKGKATFKITKFYKKGNFKAVVKFKGNKKYKLVSKKVNIKIK